MQQEYNRLYYIYTLLTGLLGLAALILVSSRAAGALAFDPWAFGALTLLALLAKFLSFKLMKLVTLTLDTAIYIATALVMGMAPAAWSVFVTMVLYILIQTWRREVRQKEHRPLLENLIAPLFQGGSGALAILLPCTFLRLDHHLADRSEMLTTVFWMAPVLALCFLALQYFLVLHKYYLLGNPWSTLFRKVMLPGIGHEMLMIPLAMAITTVYHQTTSAGASFWLLCVTYLIINVLFKEMSDASAKLENRIDQLQAFNRLGRSLGSTLQGTELVPLLSSRTLEVLKQADGILLYIWNMDLKRYDRFPTLRSGEEPEEDGPLMVHGIRLAKAVAEGRLPFSTGDLPPRVKALSEHPAGLDKGSWMAIPVISQEELLGVLVTHCQRPAGFDPGAYQLLEMVAQQATIALQNARLYVLSTTDGLTSLYVRRYFDQRLSDELARTLRYGSTFSLIFIDFDNFKGVNDTWGHTVGDRVLQDIGRLLRKEVRALDIPARIGGDEFAVILPEVSWQGAVLLAERLLKKISEISFQVPGDRFRQTVSIGIVGLPDHGCQTVSEVLQRADAALYEAKEAGRNQIRVASIEQDFAEDTDTLIRKPVKD